MNFLENLTSSAAWPFLLALLGPLVVLLDAKFGLNLTTAQLALAISTIIAAIAHSAVTNAANTTAAASTASAVNALTGPTPISPAPKAA